jgi:type II secretory pathway predicted ATPase ExeA
VAVVDDAEKLSDTALGEIALLLSACALSARPIHFILVGRRDLARRLLRPEFAQLNDLIGARSILDRMTRAEAFGYVEYWLQAAGGSTRNVFGWRALACIVEHGGGIPSRLNALCHHAMRLACATHHRKVHLSDARLAVAEVNADSPGTYRSRLRSAAHGQPTPASASGSEAAASSMNGSSSVLHRI